MIRILLYVILLIAMSLEPVQEPVQTVPVTMPEQEFTYRHEPVNFAPEPIDNIETHNNIPIPKYDYGCDPSEGIVCVNDKMTFDEQVAHTLFMEGSGDGLQLLVDMLQVIDNRAVNAWECSINECGVEELESLNPDKIPWSDITDTQAQQLVLYLLSYPYTSRGETHPVWNGWSQPMQMGKIETMFKRQHRNYLLTLRAVEAWRENCIGYDQQDGNDTCIFLELDNGKVLRPQHPICAGNVLYIYFTTGRLLKDAPVVAYDKLDYGKYIVYVQFLTLPGHGFDKER